LFPPCPARFVTASEAPPYPNGAAGGNHPNQRKTGAGRGPDRRLRETTIRPLAIPRKSMGRALPVTTRLAWETIRCLCPSISQPATRRRMRPIRTSPQHWPKLNYPMSPFTSSVIVLTRRIQARPSFRSGQGLNHRKVQRCEPDQGADSAWTGSSCSLFPQRRCRKP